MTGCPSVRRSSEPNRALVRGAAIFGTTAIAREAAQKRSPHARAPAPSPFFVSSSRRQREREPRGGHIEPQGPRARGGSSCDPGFASLSAEGASSSSSSSGALSARRSICALFPCPRASEVKEEKEAVAADFSLSSLLRVFRRRARVCCALSLVPLIGLNLDLAP